MIKVRAGFLDSKLKSSLRARPSIDVIPVPANAASNVIRAYSFRARELREFQVRVYDLGQGMLGVSAYHEKLPPRLWGVAQNEVRQIFGDI
jgi:hypothetical protein